MDTDFLDWALADFSGYVAADELYDGPFCMLSAVDNRRYKRILYDVLDHDPTHDDIRAFLGRLKTALSARDLTLSGSRPMARRSIPCPSRRCSGRSRIKSVQFHIVAEVIKAVLGAVASARKGLAATQPKLPKGRPSTPAAKAGGPHEKAARRATRRVVHPSVSVRPTSPEQNRTQDPVARQPWVAPVTRAAGGHGPGVCVIRSALSDPDRPRQTGQAAAARPAVPLPR